MSRCFNTEGLCDPALHYMVDMRGRLGQVEEMITANKYFVINRARQFGKTTLLNLLSAELADKYSIFSLSFEGLGRLAFEDENAFCRTVCALMADETQEGQIKGLDESVVTRLWQIGNDDDIRCDFRVLSRLFTELCDTAERPVVLIIDEVDQASDQEEFITFLGMLRGNYLKRMKRSTFQSVILAGVYDIKNLKLRLRPEGEQRYNSPWNIAEEFTVDMSFSAADIAGMLEGYETDHHTGMNVTAVAQTIFDYTAGYPFLVSYICKTIEKEISSESSSTGDKMRWNPAGVTEAVKVILRKRNTLFDSMIRQIDRFRELKDMLKGMLYQGRSFTYTPNNHVVNIGTMLGFLSEHEGNVIVSNRMFEMVLYNLFLSEEELGSVTHEAGQRAKNQFLTDGMLDMEMVLQKFTDHFTDVYGNQTEQFIEAEGRRLFLLYLKPIINGVGNYYIEAETRDAARTDIIVDYKGMQYIIELKIWHGEGYHEKGKRQLAGYLESYQLDKGYMISFNFNKKKCIGVSEYTYDGKTIIEAVV